MKYCGTLISVSDIKKSKEFYETVLEQVTVMDLGGHVNFESGLSLQRNYEELVGVALQSVNKSNNFQLYFEVADIDSSYAKINAVEGIEFLHGIKEYPWGQQVIRFYDFDKHIVEVSESMESVAKRFLKQGLSINETAEKTMFPVEMIQGIAQSL